MSDIRKLDTIQKEDNLNFVNSIDSEGPGGAHHAYSINRLDNNEQLTVIRFQKGPRNDENSVMGVLDGDLLEIVRDRMKSFQAGPFSSSYNEDVLTHVEAALEALNQRVIDRKNRGVLGHNKK